MEEVWTSPGHYDPSKKPAVVSINKEKLEQWIKRGARMSDTVRSLVKRYKNESFVSRIRDSVKSLDLRGDTLVSEIRTTTKH